MRKNVSVEERESERERGLVSEKVMGHERPRRRRERRRQREGGKENEM